MLATVQVDVTEFLESKLVAQRCEQDVVQSQRVRRLCYKTGTFCTSIAISLVPRKISRATPIYVFVKTSDETSSLSICAMQ